MKEYVPTYPNPDDDDRPEWEKKIRPLFSAAEDHDGEGARPSSLIYACIMPDPGLGYALMLMRELKIINERTVRELGLLPPGGLPVQKKTKPNVPYRDFQGNLVPEVPMIEESDEMKLRQIAAAAALAVGAAACNSATSLPGSAGTDHVGKPTQAPKTNVTSAPPVGAATSTSTDALNDPKPTNGPLGPEYKAIESFADFRKKLLADGWRPVVNPHCLDEVIGVDHKEYCSKYPDDVSCHACDLVPEIFIYTSQGYLTARYTKNGTPLYVGAYGDIQDLDKPGKHGLVVTVWGYEPLN